LDGHQGLKPLAESFGPFGTKTRTPVHFFDSTADPPIEDEDDDEYENEKPNR
jgi:hypothetical protein